MTSDISPEDIVMNERYLVTHEEHERVKRWMEFAICRSLTSLPKFKKYKNFLR